MICSAVRHLARGPPLQHTEPSHQQSAKDIYTYNKGCLSPKVLRLYWESKPAVATFFCNFYTLVVLYKLCDLNKLILFKTV